MKLNINRNFLKIKEVEPFALDSPERTLMHKKIVRRKYFLNKLYTEWYEELKQLCDYNNNKNIIELGSGGGFIKEILPNVITSDVLELPGIDMVFSGEKMPFVNNSIDSILMVDVFHHIPEPEKFLFEAERILKPGGTIIMTEPWNCWWARLIYQNFHHEPFDPNGNWKIINTGALSGANGALPWIFFKRDLNQFKLKFPDLYIVTINPHTPLRYLLSGGLTLKQLVPSFMFGFITILDKLLSRLNISMFAYIVIAKRN